MIAYSLKVDSANIKEASRIMQTITFGCALDDANRYFSAYEAG
jgi:hypothetical protein